ncbi:Aste57867_17039 [Aphanomyces stellatus]|uniref:Aste57867_17039 protein n=1 Tax=Aphanomyces stellatus TaxID=120398 RepID=A0A485LA90_9STRA|nr:hypothetical protein As57867_016981 [Aphanomyces stellatus]VFT93800.1 Aste57867_17039 [Aphanomyces stellatus]
MCCVPRMSSSKVMSIPSLCQMSPSEPTLPSVTAAAAHHHHRHLHRGPVHEHDLKKRELIKKVTSVRKGLEHVQQCHGACDKALCKSTRRLVDQYRTHACVNRNSPLEQHHTTKQAEAKCQVCWLWNLVAGNSSIAV